MRRASLLVVFFALRAFAFDVPLSSPRELRDVNVSDVHVASNDHGFLAAWSSERHAAYVGVYATVDQDGNVGEQRVIASHVYGGPFAASDGDRYLLAWESDENAAMLIDRDGRELWRVPLPWGSIDVFSHRPVLSDGRTFLILALSGPPLLLDRDGTVIDDATRAEGWVIDAAAFPGGYVALVRHGAVLQLWTRTRAGWSPGAVVPEAGDGARYTYRIATNGDETLVARWDDEVVTTQVFGSRAATGWKRVALTADTEGDAIWSGSDFLLVYNDTSNAAARIRRDGSIASQGPAFVDEHGTLAKSGTRLLFASVPYDAVEHPATVRLYGDDLRTPLVTAPLGHVTGDELTPSVAADGAGSEFVLWNVRSELVGGRIAPDGTKLDGDGFTITRAGRRSTSTNCCTR